MILILFPIYYKFIYLFILILNLIGERQASSLGSQIHLYHWECLKNVGPTMRWDKLLGIDFLYLRNDLLFGWPFPGSSRPGIDSYKRELFLQIRAPVCTTPEFSDHLFFDC